MTESSDLTEATRGNLAGGAAVDLFEHELARVLANVQDPNAPATKTRTITLTVDIKPTEDRAAANVKVAAKSKLASPRPAGAVIHLTTRGAMPIAVVSNPNQGRLFDATTPRLGVVGGEAEDGGTKHD